MLKRMSRYPVIVLFMGAGVVAMLLPASHALTREDYAVARTFFYAFILFGALTGFVAMATSGRQKSPDLRSQLISLVLSLLILPPVFAIPFYEAAGNITFLDAWFEMVSDLTTTGATLFDHPRELVPSLHLWRATVAWIGGLFIWISALAILAPLGLGGFEVFNAVADGRMSDQFSQGGRTIDPGERLVRYITKLTPLYLSLTGILWLGLTMAGEVPFIALCHAMSVLSTSGVSSVDGIYYSSAGFPGEVLMAVFFFFALTHRSFSLAPGEVKRGLFVDPEVRLALTLTIGLSAMLMARHLIATLEEGSLSGTTTAFHAAWGALFTTLSFVTTTGFESADWYTARDWSGLGSPGLILVAIAAIGGGIATTAGGIKLFRIYALLRHGQRELDRLVHPSSVGGSGRAARSIRREGARVAWIVFMIFGFSLASIMVLLALTGIQFESSMVLSVAALSNVGPLAHIAGEVPISYSGLPDISKIILAAAMVLGRLEALVYIALFNPEFWRR